MSAIVATLFYFPVVLIVAAALHLAGVSFDAFATFGGAFRTLPGLLVWWVVAFAGACAYAAFVFPWGDNFLDWPRKG